MNQQRSTRRWWLAGAVAVLLVASIGLVTWDRLRSGVAPGTLVEVYDLDEATGRLSGGTVMVPTGRLDVTVTEPYDELPDGVYPVDSGFRDDVEQVRDFGRYVGVSWMLDRPANDARFRLVTGAQRQFEVVLVADGVRHDLRAGDSARDSATPSRVKAVYVALPGGSADLSVEVSYDGLTQRLDPRTGGRDAGAALPFYSPAATWSAPPKPCAAQRPTAAGEGFPLVAPGFEFREPEDAVLPCELRPMVASPYEPGIGWARPGRSWLSVPLTTSGDRPFAYWPSVEADPRELYLLRLRTSTVTLGGVEPATTRQYYSQTEAQLRHSGRTGAYFVFDVDPAAAAKLVVTQAWESQVGATELPTAPPRARATATLTLTLTPA